MYAASSVMGVEIELARLVIRPLLVQYIIF